MDTLTTKETQIWAKFMQNQVTVCTGNIISYIFFLLNNLQIMIVFKNHIDF